MQIIDPPEDAIQCEEEYMTIMTKRRNKLSKESESLLADEDTDSNIAPESSTSCHHLKTAFKPIQLKKKLDKKMRFKCEECAKNQATESSEDVDTDNVWLCLACGYEGCGRSTEGKHAEKHFQLPHSKSHSLTFSLTNFQLWCYACDDEVSRSATSQLKMFVDNLEKRIQATRCDKPSNNDKQKADTKSGVKSKENNAKNSISDTSVKGLTNLGNTCFFNAVMQNLAHTHQLQYVLSDENIIVKGSKICLEPSELPGKKNPLQPVTLTIDSEIGPLLASLRSFISEYNNGKSGVLNPAGLFGQICKKAQRFSGYQQQDSHELLRCLFDAVRADEVKRIRLALSAHFGQTIRVLESVERETRKSLKKYTDAAEFTCIEQVFSGHLLQEIKCLQCQQVSKRQEMFVDLSLPVVDTKPVIKTSMDEDIFKKRTQPSKHQLKKAKQQARKQAGLKKRRNTISENDNADSENSEKTPCIEDELATKLKLDDSESVTKSQNTANEDDDDSQSEKIDNEEVTGCRDSLNQWKSDCTVSSCLDQFTAIELLTGKNKFACAHCSNSASDNERGQRSSSSDSGNSSNHSSKEKSEAAKSNVVYTDAEKRYLIESPPAVLTVGMNLRKISKHVEFQQLLDLTPYCCKTKKVNDTEQKRVLYSLYGVVSHSGRLSTGHYVAYIKRRSKDSKTVTRFLRHYLCENRTDVNKNCYLDENSEQKAATNGVDVNSKNDDSVSATAPAKWYHISDTRVAEVSESQVMSAEAYLLFYERIL